MAESAMVESPLNDSIETEVEIYSSADDVYDFFRSNCKDFPRIMPDEIQNVELLKPEWNSEGSRRSWIFVDAGKCGIWKDVVEKIDDRTKSITWTLVDGAVPKKLYCNLKVEFDFSVRRGPTAYVKVKLNYVKIKVNVPAPQNYLDFIVRMVRAADGNPRPQ